MCNAENVSSFISTPASSEASKRYVCDVETVLFSMSICLDLQMIMKDRYAVDPYS